MKKLITSILLISLTTTMSAQSLSALEIVKKADDNRRGKSLYSESLLHKPNFI